MGLLDMLNGMQNESGSKQATPSGSGSGGMPPWMMAALGLLAYKAMKGGGLGNMLGGAPGGTGRVDPAANPPASGGGLGDILGGILGGGQTGGAPGAGNKLGGLLGGAAAGGVLNGGLRHLLGDLEQNGQGDAVKSWIGTGENRSISKGDLAQAVGSEDIDAVARHTGMPREQVLSALSEHLPEVVNQLTPAGRLPTDQEASRWV